MDSSHIELPGRKLRTFSIIMVCLPSIDLEKHRNYPTLFHGRKFA